MAETLKSSGRVSAAFALSRVLGLVRESVFGFLFGAGAEADAYAVAFRIPNLLRDLLADGALSAAFVPTFTATLHDGGTSRAFELANRVLTLLTLLTGGLTLAGIVWSQSVAAAMAGSFDGDAEKLALASQLTRIMMPIMALVSVGSVWMGMLNAQRRFTLPSLAPALFNVASILIGVVLIVAGVPRDRALFVWSAGTTVAATLQAFVQLPALWRGGYRPWPRLRGTFSDPGVRRIARLIAPAIIGVAAVNLNVFVSTRFASDLGDGPVAQLQYAFRVFFLPIGVFSVALAVITTTRAAEDAARQDFDALRGSTSEAVSAVWLLMSASAVGLILLAEPVVQLLFERGAFTPSDTEQTARVLQAYCVGLLPYGLVKVLAPVFYGIDRARIPLVGSVSAVAACIVFNALTYRELGAPGLALGTTLAAFVNLTVLRLGFRRIVGTLEPGRTRAILGVLVANAVMGGVVWSAWWGGARLLEALGERLGAQLALAGILALVVTLGFLAYVAVARALGVAGAETLWALPASLLRRLRRRGAPDPRDTDDDVRDSGGDAAQGRSGGVDPKG